MPETSNATPVHEVVFINLPAITAELLGTYIQQCGMLRLVGQAQSQASLISLLSSVSPQIALVGARPGRDELLGISLIQQLRDAAPHVRSVVLGQELSEEDEIALLHSGARGLLSERDVNLSTLIKCLCAVAAGQIWANSRQLERLLRSLSRARPQQRVTNVLGEAILSRREEEVLLLLSEGLSNRDLAVELGLSEHTVKNHLFRIFDKLGVSNRMEAILYALSRRESPSTAKANQAGVRTLPKKAGPLIADRFA